MQEAKLPNIIADQYSPPRCCVSGWIDRCFVAVAGQIEVADAGVSQLVIVWGIAVLGVGEAAQESKADRRG